MKKLLILCFFISGVLHAYSYNPVVARLGGHTIHKNAVMEFVEANLVTDQLKMALFLKASRDYDLYQKEYQKFLDENFNDGLKHYLYTQMLYLDYSSFLGTKTVLFKVSESHLYQALTAIENQALEPYLKKGIGIHAARTEFGKAMIAQNYPHKKNELPQDLFWSWYKNEEARLIVKDRMQSAGRWELTRASFEQPKITIDPLKKVEFFKSTQKTINDLLVNKSMSKKELETILKAHPEMQALISRLELSNYLESPLETFLQKSDFAPFIANITDVLIGEGNKFLAYEEKAFSLAQKYNDKEQLKKLSKEQLNIFLSDKGNFSNLMLSKLYTIAEKIVVENPERMHIREEMISIFRNALNDIEKNITVLSAHAHQPLELALGEFIKERFKKKSSRELIEESYMVKSIDMLIFTAQFSVRKVAEKEKGRVVIETLPINRAETFARIQDYLEKEKIQKYILEFKENDLRYHYKDYLVIFGDRPISGMEAMNFVLN